MHLRNELFELTKECTSEEYIFKAYYNTKGDPKLFAEFVNRLSPKTQASVYNWIKAEKGELLTEFTENTDGFNFQSNIIVSRHSRYCPAFIHKHTFFEIVVILSGSCVNYINDQEVTLSEGDICIIAPGHYHALRDSKDAIIYNILIKHYNFSDTFHTFLLQNNPLSSFFMQALYADEYQKYILFHTKNDIYLQTLLDILILEHEKSEDNSKLGELSESLVSSIFNYLVLRHTDISENSIFANTNSQIILRIKEYITENIKEASLSTLSDKFNYSPTYLSKLVHRVTGYNISNIIRRVRIDRACCLLSNTDLSVTEIGELVGYNSTRQFNRAFYALINKTPTEYRRRNRSLLYN